MSIEQHRSAEVTTMSTNATAIGMKRVGRGRWLALGALVLSGLVLGLDTTILVTALPTLSAKLGATTDQLQWMSTAYTLALAGLMLPAAVLADRYGRRLLLMAGLLVFGVSSVVASQLSSANGLIFMRALMGAGGAVILPLMLAILPTIFAEDERRRALALAGAGVFLGLPLGPLVAGYLLTHYDWGSIFLINGPVVVLALLGVGFFVPESKDPEAHSLDWIGAVLEVVGVTALVYGIIEEPLKGWTDPQVLVPLVGGAILIAAFVGWELRLRVPLVDLRLFLNPRFAWATAAFTMVGFGLTGAMFILTPYLQVVQGNDAQETGIRLLPMIAAVFVGALASDRLTARLGTKVMVAGGLLISAAGLVLLSRVGPDTGYGLVAAGLAVTGVGISLAMIPALDSILGALPVAQTGAGNALTRVLQNIGASFGVAIMGSVLNSAYRASLSGHLVGLPTQVSDGALSGVAVAAAIATRIPAPLAVPLRHAAYDAYAVGMAQVLVVSAGLLAAVAVLIALFLPARAAGAEARAEAPDEAVSRGAVA